MLGNTVLPSHSLSPHISFTSWIHPALLWRDCEKSEFFKHTCWTHKKGKEERDKDSCTNILTCSVSFNRPHYAASSTDRFCTLTCCSVTIESLSPPASLCGSHWKLAFMYQSMMGETDLIRSSESGSHTLNVLAALGCPLCSFPYYGKYPDKWTADSTLFKEWLATLNIFITYLYSSPCFHTQYAVLCLTRCPTNKFIDLKHYENIPIEILKLHYAISGILQWMESSHVKWKQLLIVPNLQLWWAVSSSPFWLLDPHKDYDTDCTLVFTFPISHAIRQHNCI